MRIQVKHKKGDSIKLPNETITFISDGTTFLMLPDVSSLDEIVYEGEGSIQEVQDED